MDTEGVYLFVMAVVSMALVLAIYWYDTTHPKEPPSSRFAARASASQRKVRPRAARACHAQDPVREAEELVHRYAQLIEPLYLEPCDETD